MTSDHPTRFLTKEEAEILAQLLLDSYPLTQDNIDCHNQADFDIAIRVIHALQPKPQAPVQPKPVGRPYLKIVK